MCQIVLQLSHVCGERARDTQLTLCVAWWPMLSAFSPSLRIAQHSETNIFTFAMWCCSLALFHLTSKTGPPPVWLSQRGLGLGFEFPPFSVGVSKFMQHY